METMTADLTMTAEEHKTAVRDSLGIPEAPAANPFGPEADTAGDAGGNHFAQNTRYLKGHAVGNYKASQYLAVYGNVEGVAKMVTDTMATLIDEGNELVQIADTLVANFLVSVYVEKHGWKAGTIEEAAVARFADEIGGVVVTGESAMTAAKNEGREIDRTIVMDDGERVTVQVKANTKKNVKAKNRDKVDYLLRVTADVNEKEISFGVENVE